MALTLTLLTLATALLDWIAVGRRAADPESRAARTAEIVLKPLTLALLIGAAVAIAHDHAGVCGLVVIATLTALGFSLLGDVFLLGDKFFVPGLAAFLLAHVAYIVAFVKIHYPKSSYGLSFIVTGLALAVATFVLVGLPVVRGAAEEDPKLRIPVLAYLTVISAMLVAAWWTGDLRIIPGALLFAFSDSLIGWTKFVRRDWELGVPIIVTYHLAQVLLVLGLLRR